MNDPICRFKVEGEKMTYFSLGLLQIQAHQSVIEQISGMLRYGMRSLLFYADWLNFRAVL